MRILQACLRYTSECNIGCKTLFSERGKLPLKLTCPAGTSTCPATLLNNGEIGICPKHYLPSGASQGLVQLAPLSHCRFLPNSIATCNGASGYVARCRYSSTEENGNKESTQRSPYPKRSGKLDNDGLLPCKLLFWWWGQYWSDMWPQGSNATSLVRV